MSDRSEANRVSDDLVERVGRELARTGYAFAGIDLTDPYTADADYWNSQARAAISVVLEEAAKVADKRATELSILRDGAPHVDANGQLSWSDYNYCCVEIRSLAIELCKLALEEESDE